MFKNLFQLKPRETQPAPGFVMQEEAPRPRPPMTPTYKEARILYPGGYMRRGVVLAYNDHRARVRFPTRESLPDTVRVLALSLSLDCYARVSGRDGFEVDLEFVSEDSVAA